MYTCIIVQGSLSDVKVVSGILNEIFESAPTRLSSNNNSTNIDYAV